METLEKRLKVLEVFSEFESLLRRLFVRDQAILAPNKVAMCVCVVDVRDKNDLGAFLEDTIMESVLTNIWENVQDIVTRYTKRQTMAW